MKPDTANSKDLDLVGNRIQASAQETLAATLKRWRRTLAYCSIFSSVPAVLASQVLSADAPKKQQTRFNEVNRAETTLARRSARVQWLNRSFSKPALLKRQSEFRLPHQENKFDLVAALGGSDDCPGRAIPGGTYTAATPFSDSGNTTGANNSVTRLLDSYYYYYSTDTQGPDHVYSFTLTAMGQQPEIEISTTTSYRPLIYVLQGGFNGACPAGTGNTVGNMLAVYDTRWNDSSSITASINFLPLNVPLYLFVDSRSNDASGSGPYNIRMRDVTISSSSCSISNAIDCTEFFVRQHYNDFLNREPDAGGMAFWTNEITSCGGDVQCAAVKRINVSAAFFLSIEFQRTGYLVYRTHAAALGPRRIGGTVPLTLVEFIPDVQRVGDGVAVGTPGWTEKLEANQVAYFNEFVTRPNFVAAYPTTMSNSHYVDALNANAGNALSTAKRDQLVSDLASGAKTRAQVLRAVAEDEDFSNAEFNRAFVLMQYFGYLRRNPHDAPDNDFGGYNFWLSKLNQFNGNFIESEMVKAFIDSIEYRRRFGT